MSDDVVDIVAHLAGADPEAYLDRVDAVARQTFRHLLRQHRHADAVAFMLDHLARTEKVRVVVEGVPDFDEAYAEFELAWYRQRPEAVAAMPVHPALRHPVQEPTRVLVPVPAAVDCGHVEGVWTCIQPAHPEHPNGHVYVSTDGSAVPDRHTTTTPLGEVSVMSLTNTEATKLNVLLHHVFDLPDVLGGVPSADDAVDAAVYLADRASATLGAGLRGKDVSAAAGRAGNSE